MRTRRSSRVSGKKIVKKNENDNDEKEKIPPSPSTVSSALSASPSRRSKRSKGNITINNSIGEVDTPPSSQKRRRKLSKDSSSQNDVKTQVPVDTTSVDIIESTTVTSGGSIEESIDIEGTGENIESLNGKVMNIDMEQRTGQESEDVTEASTTTTTKYKDENEVAAGKSIIDSKTKSEVDSVNIKCEKEKYDDDSNKRFDESKNDVKNPKRSKASPRKRWMRNAMGTDNEKTSLAATSETVEINSTPDTMEKDEIFLQRKCTNEIDIVKTEKNDCNKNDIKNDEQIRNEDIKINNVTIEQENKNSDVNRVDGKAYDERNTRDSMNVLNDVDIRVENEVARNTGENAGNCVAQNNINSNDKYEKNNKVKKNVMNKKRIKENNKATKKNKELQHLVDNIRKSCLHPYRNSLHTSVKWRILERAEVAGVVQGVLYPPFLQSAAIEVIDGISNVDGNEIVNNKAMNPNESAYLISLLTDVRHANGSSSSSSGGGPLSFITSTPIIFPYDNECQNNGNLELENKIRAKAFQNLISVLISQNNDINDATIEETTSKIRFLSIAFTSTDAHLGPIVDQTLSLLTNIAMWKHMRPRYRDLEIRKSPAYRRRWGAFLSKNSNNVSINGDNCSNKNKNLEGYLPQLVKNVFIVLNGINVDNMKLQQCGDLSGNNDNSNNKEPLTLKLDFLHSSLRLLIDLLSSTSTRRYLRPYLLSENLTVRCTLSLLHQSFFLRRNDIKNDRLEKDRARLFVRLTSMLSEIETHGVHDLTAAPLTPSAVSALYYERAHVLQKMIHLRHSESFPDLPYAGVSAVCDPSYLAQHLERAEDKNVIDLACRLRLLDKGDSDLLLTDNGKDGGKLARAVLLRYHTLPPSEARALRSLSLYPDEVTLWDPFVLPPGDRPPQPGETLALPKMNIGFLTFGDYLARSFKLVRLESAYEIRGDIVDAIRRMRPASKGGYNDDGVNAKEISDDGSKSRAQTQFHGWARMALELNDAVLRKDDPPTSPVRILRVSPARLGERIPAEVFGEIMIDLQHCGEGVKAEWEGVGEHDNLFLVAVNAQIAEGGPAPFVDNHSDKEEERYSKQISDEEDTSFSRRFGIVAVRGCMVTEVRDGDGNIVSGYHPTNKQNDDSTPDSKVKKGRSRNRRFFRVLFDPAQYAMDAIGEAGGGSPLGLGVYSAMNVIVRRHGRENNFRSVLETVRGLLLTTGSVDRSVPSWLQPVLLGYGDPSSASFDSRNMRSFALKTVGVTSPNAALNYGDTFLDTEHLVESFKGCDVTIDNCSMTGAKPMQSSYIDTINSRSERRQYRVRVVYDNEESHGNNNNDVDVYKNGVAALSKTSEVNKKKLLVEATTYPFQKGEIRGNSVRFTPVQVKAIRSGLSPGLTLIVGPPGTGKTDVAVQIIVNLYKSFPTQRTILVTHSNAALNDLFDKVATRGDVNECHILRLGAGERDLRTKSDQDFTKQGRVEHVLARRGVLLEKVQLLSESLEVSGATERGPGGCPSYTCETAEYFNLHHVRRRVQAFFAQVLKMENIIGSSNGNESILSADVARIFPFCKYFKILPNNNDDGQFTLSVVNAKEMFGVLDKIFEELAEYRPMELLRTQKKRADYLLTKQARIVAMTCTHAAIARSHLVALGFQYDNVIMEEAGQVIDVETFIPLLLQKGASDTAKSALSTRLKRVCLIGDHHQLPPVVKNMSFSKYSNLDQSLFTRLIRLGVPTIDLNRQGRARPDIASLYNWRYRDLGNLDHVLSNPTFQLANAGFAHSFQLINVEDFGGKGETTPTAYFYQNIGEAEYAVALFQYMVLIGYPPEKISILTTYNGQKELLLDILGQRCGPGTPLDGVKPCSVSTVDHYQGQQNDYVILSLVRTKAIGHLRDVRRLVVAVSRARLGLYVLCRQNLFSGCHDLRRTLDQLASKSNKLELVMGENFPVQRSLDDKVPDDKKYVVDDLTVLGSIVHDMQRKICVEE